MSTCQQLQEKIDQLVERRNELRQEQKEPGASQVILFKAIRAVEKELLAVRNQFSASGCTPRELPDLRGDRFVMGQENGGTVRATGVIRNIGKGPAAGPFKVVLGVQDGDIYREHVALVPPGTTIAGHGTEYVVPDPIVGITSNHYKLFMLIDSDNQVRETHEDNNYFEV